MSFPKTVEKVKVPPIKIQGIKTKLVPFIAANISWDGTGRYFEPFMGSGVVGFNLAPERATFSDSNPHIIRFYQAVQSGEITGQVVRDYLEREGSLLRETGPGRDSYFYEVRDRFNETGDPLDFLFLQRSNFNGMLRFNGKGKYNVPFGRKPERFAPALITRIVNQVEWVSGVINSHPDWSFETMSFEECFNRAESSDFIYMDPPYIDRNDTYFDAWTQQKALALRDLSADTQAGFALSMWLENQHRRNDHLDLWNFGQMATTEHFYHVGAKEKNRSAMQEALVVSPKHVVDRALVSYGAPEFEAI